MSLEFVLKNSNVAQKQPFPSDLGDAEIAVNVNEDDPFIAIKDSAGAVRRLDRCSVGTDAPESPSDGQLWLDTTGGGGVFKVYRGPAGSGAWVSGITQVGPATTDSFGTVKLADAADLTSPGSPTAVVTAKDLLDRLSSGTVSSVSGTAPVTIGGTPSDPIVGVSVASSDAPGVVELADDAEAAAGSATDRAITPFQLRQYSGEVDAITVNGAITDSGSATNPNIGVRNATTTETGVVELATQAEVDARTGGLVVTADTLPATFVESAAVQTPLRNDGDATDLNLGIDAATNLADGVVKVATQTEFDASSADHVPTAEQVQSAIVAAGGVGSVSGTTPIQTTGTTAVTVSVLASSTSQSGVIQIANASDITTGTNTTKAVTPAQLAQETSAITAQTLQAVPTVPTAPAVAIQNAVVISSTDYAGITPDANTLYFVLQ